MYTQNLRRFLISAAVLGSSDKAPSTKCDQLCRASELPIYRSDEVMKEKQQALSPPEPGMIGTALSSVRKQVWSVFDGFKVYQGQAKAFIEENQAKTNSWLKYLAEEADDPTRMGAVGLGAITGYILGMRGGFFRRILYSGITTGGMSAICYPKQTAQYSQEGIAQAKKYTIIGYNFIAGVKPGEEVQFPKMPTSFSEAWDLASNMGKSTPSVTDKANTSEEVKSKK